MGSSKPVHIRRNIDNYRDPYLEASGDTFMVCSECHAVFQGQHWYLADQARKAGVRLGEKSPTSGLCPACQKSRDNVPGGILTISGVFAAQHREEIFNLIHNENERAMGVNPLERVMSVEGTEDGFEVTTTNERLAQRIGRALHKAYDGEVIYRWSGDTKLARVAWRRG